MSQNDVTALFDQWNAAIQTGDPKTVAALYESNGILLPTLSNKVRHNHEEIEDYLRPMPRGVKILQDVEVQQIHICVHGVRGQK